MNNVIKTLFTLTSGFCISLSAVALPSLSVVTKIPATGTNYTPAFTFYSSEAGTLIYGGDCVADKKSAVAGNNTLTFKRLHSGIHSNCTVKVRNSASETSAALAIPGFTISYVTVTKLTITRYEDMGNDGIVDNKYVTTYDANGSIIKETLDAGLTGNVITTSKNTYDNMGNATAYVIDYDHDGVNDLTTKQVNTYTNGKLVKSVITSTIAGNTYPSYSRTFTYNSKNKLVSATTASSTVKYTYNSNGKLATLKTYSGQDTTPSITENLTYNSSGYLTKSAISSTFGFSYTTAITWLAGGKPNKISDSFVPSSMTFTYDANGLWNGWKGGIVYDVAINHRQTLSMSGDKTLIPVVQSGIIAHALY